MKKRLLAAFILVLVLLTAAGAGSCWLVLHRTPGEFFDSNGVPIYYTVEGSGEPVILIHGVGANADLNWRRPGVVRTLARDFKVITFDLRGHGRSGQPTDPAKYGMEMVEDAVRLMDHLHIDKAHIAGYSLGGFITLKLITTHPDRIRSAAICAAGWTDATDPDQLPSPYSAPVPPGEKKTKPKEAAAASVLPLGLPAATQKTLFHRIRNWVGDQIVNKSAIRALKKSYRSLALSEESLRNNKVPSILFIGSQDGFYYLAQDLRGRMANMEYRCIEGANHFTTPLYGEFKQNLHEFFQRHKDAAVSP